MHCETPPAVHSESFFAKCVQRDLSREIIKVGWKIVLWRIFRFSSCCGSRSDQQTAGISEILLPVYWTRNEEIEK